MTDKQKLEHLLSKLQEKANSKHCLDVCGDDYSPSETGSYDDTFNEGSCYGEIAFARELLRHIQEDWEDIQIAIERKDSVPVPTTLEELSIITTTTTTTQEDN